MILCVTLNAALDVTYTADRVRLHAGNRVRSVRQRAGGKGINVARVLAALGHPAVSTGLVAGATGEQILIEARRSGLPEAFVAIRGESRRTVAVVDAATGDATGFWEPGADVAPADWKEFLATFRVLVGGAAAVVLSGSAPPGVPADAYAQLLTEAASQGVPAVLDADGDALGRALPARPTIVKPNAEELKVASGSPSALSGAETLRALGAEAVVASFGADGLVAVTPDGRWRARPPTRAAGNPTGAGDATVAALAAGLVAGQSWPERLVHAVALSAAAVLAPLAGDVDIAAYHRLRRHVVVSSC